jgi:nuclear pore complex protein Nup54
VDPNQVSLYGRPQDATNDALWQKAVRENPDPTWYDFLHFHRLVPHPDALKSMVPALALGFDDLQNRVAAQTQQAAAHEEKLKVCSASPSNTDCLSLIITHPSF